MQLPRLALFLCGIYSIINCTLVSAAPPSFKNDIAPILLQQCVACHGPKKAAGKWRADTWEKLTAAGESGALGIGKKLDDSEVWKRLTSADKDERMPLENEPLPAEQLAKFKAWLEAGATFDGPDAKAPLIGYVPPPVHPAAPEKYPATLPITAMTFTPDGSQLLVSGYHEITVWNPADGQLIRRIGNVAQRIYGMSLSPDGAQLAVATGTPGRLGEARIFQVANGELVRAFGLTTDVVFDVAFNPAGDRIATAGADSTLRGFEVASGKEVITSNSHSDWVFAVAWSPDGSKLATASRDKTAKVFTAADGKLLISYSNHNQAVRGVLFHPDGEQVYSAGADNKVQRWKIGDAARVSELGLGGEGYHLISAGEFFLTTSAEPKVRQIQAKEQKQIREYAGLKDWATAAAFHAGTKRIAAGGFDGEVKLWDSETGQPAGGFMAAPGLVAKP